MPPFPEPSLMILVPVVMPTPDLVWPTAREPEDTEITVKIYPAHLATTVAELVAVMVVLEAVCEEETTYSPIPPVICLVIFVPCLMPDPVMYEPTATAEVAVMVTPEPPVVPAAEIV